MQESPEEMYIAPHDDVIHSVAQSDDASAVLLLYRNAYIVVDLVEKHESTPKDLSILQC